MEKRDRFNALLERALRDPHGEEGRTAAVLACQEYAKRPPVASNEARELALHVLFRSLSTENDRLRASAGWLKGAVRTCGIEVLRERVQSRVIYVIYSGCTIVLALSFAPPTHLLGALVALFCCQMVLAYQAIVEWMRMKQGVK